MIEIFITVWLGTGGLGDRTIVQSISQKVLIDVSKHKSCKQLIINETVLTKDQLDNKALMYICDYPKPKVKSSVIQLKPLSKPLYDVSFKSVEKITHMAFSQRRKMLKTSLKTINGQTMLKELGISPNLRPENLTVIDFCKIAKKSFEEK